MKVRDIRPSSLEEFICCFLQDRFDIDSILDITCCIHCFCPEMFSQIIEYRNMVLVSLMNNILNPIIPTDAAS